MQPITPQSVLDALTWHVGEAYGVSARALASEVTGGDDSPGAQRRLRHVIEHLRRAGHAICGHPSTGYFVAANDDELNRTCDYLYHRALCSLEQIAALKRVALPDIRGQLRLPT